MEQSSDANQGDDDKNKRHFKIFKQLLSLTNTQDFKDAELAFYRKSVKHFMPDLDPNDEQVLMNQKKQHEELLTVKTALDGLLTEKSAFQFEELIEFYLSFSDLSFIRNTETYSKEDLLTIELIQKFLEFHRFQQFMINFATMNQEDQDFTYRILPVEKGESNALLEA